MAVSVNNFLNSLAHSRAIRGELALMPHQLPPARYFKTFPLSASTVLGRGARREAVRRSEHDNYYLSARLRERDPMEEDRSARRAEKKNSRQSA